PVNNSNQIEFTLLEGDYMEPIITSKVTFDVKEARGLIAKVSSSLGAIQTPAGRIVSRTVILTGQNEVPIMIVNEKGERIEKIPMIDAVNLDGKNMGKDKFHDDPFRITLEFQNFFAEPIEKVEATILLDGRAYFLSMEEEYTNSGVLKGNYLDIVFELYFEKTAVPPPPPPALTSFREQYFKINQLFINGENFLKDNFEIPQYILNEKRIASNMIVKDEDIENLDQRQFVSKNSKFKILINETGNNSDEIEVVVNTFFSNGKYAKRTNYIKLYKTVYGAFESEYFYLTGNDYVGSIVKMNGEDYKVIKVDYLKENFDRLEIVYNLRKLRPKTGKLMYAVLDFNFWEQSYIFGEEIFKETIEIMEDLLGYSVTVDLSPTKEKFLSEVGKNKFSSYYINCHGTHDLPNIDPKFYSIVLGNNRSEIDTEDISNLNLKQSEFIFFNSCGSGLPSDYNLDFDFPSGFNTETYFGWNFSIIPIDVLVIGKKFFEKCSEVKSDKLNYTLLEAIIEATKNYPKYKGNWTFFGNENLILND
ncbi:MAG: hypothetical protein WC337_10585, partial [Candidatus Muiribacteriota bacterium]